MTPSRSQQLVELEALGDDRTGEQNELLQGLIVERWTETQDAMPDLVAPLAPPIADPVRRARTRTIHLTEGDTLRIEWALIETGSVYHQTVTLPSIADRDRDRARRRQPSAGSTGSRRSETTAAQHRRMIAHVLEDRRA